MDWREKAEQVEATPSEFAIFIGDQRAWEGTFHSVDAAKQVLVKVQRNLNKKGYNPVSERLEIRDVTNQ